MAFVGNRGNRAWHPSSRSTGRTHQHPPERVLAKNIIYVVNRVTIDTVKCCRQKNGKTLFSALLVRDMGHCIRASAQRRDKTISGNERSLKKGLVLGVGDEPNQILARADSNERVKGNWAKTKGSQIRHGSAAYNTSSSPLTHISFPIVHHH